ncbi:hypothetical protein V9T40_004184 [Parthenolecanium corni]|uniref:MULE transposase domain-containing protein n=1 Tax=Parthenolecanium corni TaxID=536013 RepID=A0AAN9TTK9_9HEMI
MVTFTEMYSEKGQVLRVIEGYKFSFHKRLRDGKQRFKCTKNSCKCYVIFNADGSTAVDKTQGHEHNFDTPDTLVRQKLSNALKRKAVDNLSEKPAKIIRRALLEDGTDDVTHTDIQRIRRNLYEARSRVRPPLPHSLAELHTSLNSYDRLTTNKGERFLLVNDTHKNIIIFSSPSNLEYLSSSPTILVDGTFKSVPALFKQLFTIHGLRFGRYVPLVFCLLPSKESAIYEAAFHHIVAEVVDIGHSMQPEVCYVDFEEGIHKAVQSVWPATIIRGCRFHLGQSWWRHIQLYSLSEDYKNQSSDIGNYLKMFFGLPFLHPADVEDCFLDDLLPMKGTDPTGNEFNADPRVKNFTDYIFRTYIGPNSKFPPHMWAEYSSSIARTTNPCEAFHSHFNSDFYSAHPNIFVFIENILEIQCETYAKMLDAKKFKKPAVSQQKEKIIATLMNRRDLGELNRLEFLKRVSYKFLPFRN